MKKTQDQFGYALVALCLAVGVGIFFPAFLSGCASNGSDYTDRIVEETIDRDEDGNEVVTKRVTTDTRIKNKTRGGLLSDVDADVGTVLDVREDSSYTLTTGATTNVKTRVPEIAASAASVGRAALLTNEQAALYAIVELMKKDGESEDRIAELEAEIKALEDADPEQE